MFLVVMSGQSHRLRILRARHPRRACDRPTRRIGSHPQIRGPK